MNQPPNREGANPILVDDVDQLLEFTAQAVRDPVELAALEKAATPAPLPVRVVDQLIEFTDKALVTPGLVNGQAAPPPTPTNPVAP
jgi:hypothetical protein